MRCVDPRLAGRNQVGLAGSARPAANAARRTRLLAALGMSVGLLGLPALAATPAQYDVTWTAESFPNATVEARFDVVDGVAGMSDSWASFFDDPRGWASFIRNLEAWDAGGAPLALEVMPEYAWRVGEAHSGAVRLRYTVDFSFAGQSWPMGNEQVALHLDGALYTTGLPLFVHPPDLTEATVAFHLPEGWHVATAWSGGATGPYRVPSRDRLLRNSLVTGQHHQETLEVGPFELRVALVGAMAEGAPLVRDALRRILEYYVELFDDRQAAQFLMVLLPGPNDGEAYFDSFASSQPTAPTLEDRLVWGNSLAHEFFHYWNGKKITTEHSWRAERQWFSEGFSEYYANRALRDLALIDEAEYREIVSQYLGLHLLFAKNPYFAEVSIKDAGNRKWPNRPGVYDSGAAVAFCLDGLIHRTSAGERSLDTMLRDLNVRFGRTGRPYRYDDLVAAASAAAGEDLADFFARHVAGKEPLPVESCARDHGLRALVDGYHVFLRPSTGRSAP